MTLQKSRICPCRDRQKLDIGSDCFYNVFDFWRDAVNVIQFRTLAGGRKIKEGIGVRSFIITNEVIK